LALQAITKEIIQECVAATRKAGAALKSVKNHLVLLKQMLASAVEDGYLVVSPATKVKLAKVTGKKPECLNAEEVLHLLNGIHEDGQSFIKAGWYVPVKLVIFSGLRQGEQFALRVGDLDFHNGQARIERGLTWDDKRHAAGEVRYHFDTPKTDGSIRNVDLPPDLLEDLRRYVAGLPDQEPDRLLFSTGVGTPLDPKNVVDRVFNPALRRAGLRHIPWHALRHTYASLQLESGANIKYVSEQMGHADVSITLNRYMHLLKSSHPAQAAKLSALVFGPTPAAPQRRAVPATVLLPEREKTHPNTTEHDGTPHVKEVSYVPMNTEHDGTPATTAVVGETR
jgi:integrase